MIESTLFPIAIGYYLYQCTCPIAMLNKPIPAHIRALSLSLNSSHYSKNFVCFNPQYLFFERMLPRVVSILGQDHGKSNTEITLNSSNTVGHTTFLELTSILITKIYVGHINFQPKLNSSKKKKHGSHDLFSIKTNVGDCMLCATSVL